jgi:hypothetical protein
MTNPGAAAPGRPHDQPAFLTGLRREAGEDAVYARLGTEVPGDLLTKYFEETDRA